MTKTIRRYRLFSGGLSDKDKDKVRKAGFGVGLFMAFFIVGGLIYIMTKIRKK